MRMLSWLVVASIVALTSGPQAAGQTQAPPASTPAGGANPELVGALSKELGSTPAQAEGAAGALFGLAKTRLKPEEFSRIASAVPGMDSLLKAAPAVGTTGATGASAGALSQIPGSPAAGNLGGLANVAGSFTKLGLQPDAALKAVPILTNYVTKTGGADVGQLLAGALK